VALATAAVPNRLLAVVARCGTFLNGRIRQPAPHAGGRVEWSLVLPMRYGRAEIAWNVASGADVGAGTRINDALPRASRGPLK
jgi:hypothetical protein